MTDLIEGFLRELRRSDLDAKHIAMNERMLYRFQAFMDDKAPEEATSTDGLEFIHHALDVGWAPKGPLKKVTLEGQLTAINQWHKWLEDIEQPAKENWVERAKRRAWRGGTKKEAAKPRRLIELDDWHTLYQHSPEWLHPVLLGMPKALTRIGEFCSIDTDDVTWTGPLRGQIVLKPWFRKRSNFIVWVDEETMVAWEAYRDARPPAWAPRGNDEALASAEAALFRNSRGGRLTPWTVNRVLDAAATAGGLHDHSTPQHERITSHLFRYMGTSMLRNSGIDGGMDRDMVRHLRGDIGRDTIDHYHKFAPPVVRATYQRHAWRFFDDAKEPVRDFVFPDAFQETPRPQVAAWPKPDAR